MKNPYEKLAIDSIRHYFEAGNYLKAPAGLPPEMFERAGVFVTIKINNKLRGCIGTIKPEFGSIAEEIIQNAVSAAFHDPRFYPIGKDEFDLMDIEVSILSGLEPVRDAEMLDPEIYGLVVEKNGKNGVLLPEIEDIDTVEKQVNYAMKKALITETKGMKMFRFTVEKHFS